MSYIIKHHHLVISNFPFTKSQFFRVVHKITLVIAVVNEKVAICRTLSLKLWTVLARHRGTDEGIRTDKTKIHYWYLMQRTVEIWKR